jgi:hypothetical protein
MTEAEWLSCNAPDEMLKSLGRRASGRKLRLFACACYRHVPKLFADERVKTAIEISERYADGLASKTELAHALSLAYNPMWTIGRMAFPTPRCVESARHKTASKAKDGAAERAFQARLLRDLFYSLGRRYTVTPVWLRWKDALVVRLAQAAYDERILPGGTLDNTRLLILADALEEAGCTDEQILGHLRSDSDHYRGCFVLDTLLGKS